LSIVAEKSTIAKPFLKWAGGKGQLLAEINKRLPLQLQTGEIDTYFEPFVGGGAVFFHIAQKYPDIKRFFLFDINPDLVFCYNAIKDKVDQVIRELSSLQQEYQKKRTKHKDFYYQIRTEFNSDRSPAKLIFLNKTCYNGLYRVNKAGLFNVPSGDYKNPTICNEDNLRSVSSVLQKAEIIFCDFEQCRDNITETTFVYLDPPYRPLSPSAGFTSYSKEDFRNDEQIRLAEFCKEINRRGAKFLLSNSDPKNEDPEDHFFEDKYEGFEIERVKATRAINCKASGRGQINELIITN